MGNPEPRTGAAVSEYSYSWGLGEWVLFPLPGRDKNIASFRKKHFGGYLKYDHHHYCEAQVEDYDAEDDAEGDGRAVFLREAPNSLTNNSKKGDIFPFGAMSPFYCFFSRGPSLR